VKSLAHGSAGVTVEVSLAQYGVVQALLDLGRTLEYGVASRHATGRASTSLETAQARLSYIYPCNMIARVTKVYPQKQAHCA
jgi:hypothetical protein